MKLVFSLFDDRQAFFQQLRKRYHRPDRAGEIVRDDIGEILEFFGGIGWGSHDDMSGFLHGTSSLCVYVLGRHTGQKEKKLFDQ